MTRKESEGAASSRQYTLVVHTHSVQVQATKTLRPLPCHLRAALVEEAKGLLHFSAGISAVL